nr:uncharacterized protein At5g43822-like [Ipomoea batatas]
MRLIGGRSFILDCFPNLLMLPPSSRDCREGFHSIVLSFEKIVRDSRQQVKGGSAQPTVKQLQQRIGIKPSLADCLDGLTILSEMHQSEYRLKLSLVSATSTLALKPSVTDDLSVLQQLLVDQPNIPKDEGVYKISRGSTE